MNSEIFFSIVMPVFNGKKYLEETLISISKQRYTTFEVIFINDNSTDCSLEILLDFCNKNQNVTTTIINNSITMGASYSRNRGIEVARGKYIFFCDADDIMNINLLEECYEFLSVNRINLLRFNSESLSINSETRSFNEMKKLDTGVIDMDLFLSVNKKKISHVVWTYVYSKEFLIINDLKFYEGISYEDTLFVTKSFYYSNQIGYLNKNLYLYRIGHSSVMMENKKKRKRSARYLRIVLEELRDFKTNNVQKFSKEYLNFFEDFQIHLYFQMLSLSHVTFRQALWLFRNLEVTFILPIILKKIIGSIVRGVRNEY